MKKQIHILVFILICISSNNVFSQDVIIKMSGEEIESKIIEINTTEIKYKKHSLPDGPLYVIQKSEVFMIKYSNGEKELINKKEEKTNNSSNKDTSKVTSVVVTYSSLSGKKKDIPEFWAAFKLSPLLSFVGEYPLFFEYALKKKSSVEFGLGATYPNLLMTGIYDAVYFDLEGRQKNIGYSVSANYRLYPDIVFEEFFIGLDFRYKSYLTKLTSCGGTSFQKKEEKFNYLDFKLMVGYVTDIGSSGLAEFFVSFGLRNTSWNYYACSNSGTLLSFEKIVDNNTAPTLSLGIKLGLGLEREEIKK